MSLAASDSPVTELSSLDLIYTEARAKIDEQSRTVDALNTKAIALLAAATAMTALAAQTVRVNVTVLSVSLLIIAGALYLGLLVACLMAVIPQRFNFPPSPVILWEHYSTASPAETKQVIVETIVDAYKHNERQLQAKVFHIKTALWLLLAEAVSLLAAIVVSV